MPSETALGLISVAGSALSLVGVVVAVWQILKVKSAALAAERAATDTKTSLSRNFLLSDMSSCSTAIDELKVLVRAGRTEAALIRVGDLHRLLLQLQSSPGLGPNSSVRFRQPILQLAVLRELLERTTQGDGDDYNPVTVNNRLSEIGDVINRQIGELKFNLPGGKQDAAAS